jgi:hypothetical protein
VAKRAEIEELGTEDLNKRILAALPKSPIFRPKTVSVLQFQNERYIGSSLTAGPTMKYASIRI